MKKTVAKNKAIELTEKTRKLKKASKNTDKKRKRDSEPPPPRKKVHKDNSDSKKCSQILVDIRPVGEGNFEQTVQFLVEWVTDGEAGAREHLADHATGEGSSFVAIRGDRVVGIVTVRWRSNYPDYRDRGIPLLQQITVAEPFRRQGIATALMNTAEQLVRDRGVTTLGITVGLFDKYGPAQRMYVLRGYVPDGRGVCLQWHPVSQGATVTIDHDLIIWLTKDLNS